MQSELWLPIPCRESPLCGDLHCLNSKSFQESGLTFQPKSNTIHVKIITILYRTGRGLALIAVFHAAGCSTSITFEMTGLRLEE